MSHPLFEIVKTTTGALSIRNKIVNEIMHNPVGPWLEANALYIDQSNLKSRLLHSDQDELVLYDVGLGAGANALAALACAKSAGPNAKKLKIVSFEKDLELLRFALMHAEQFDHFKGYEAALVDLLKNKFWQDANVSWKLHEGNFLEKIDLETSLPHLIYFDPYSPKVNREMWTEKSFSKLSQKMRSSKEGGTLLYTYTQATSVRVSMMLAGFFVGQGLPTGLKNETTEAASSLELLRSPLAEPWFRRWQRSQEAFPYGSDVEDHPRIRQFVEQYMKNNFGLNVKETI